jgi:hypothetical protein
METKQPQHSDAFLLETSDMKDDEDYPEELEEEKRDVLRESPSQAYYCDDVEAEGVLKRARFEYDDDEDVNFFEDKTFIAEQLQDQHGSQSAMHFILLFSPDRASESLVCWISASGKLAAQVPAADSVASTFTAYSLQGDQHQPDVI